MIEAVRSAVERRAWIVVANFGLERVNFDRRNVGRVADDKVEFGSVWEGGEAVAQEKLNAIVNGIAGGVLFGEVKRFGRAIAGKDLKGRQFGGKGDGDTTAAGAPIKGD